MAFKLNFAPHLGFPSPDNPLFGALVGSSDPVEQMRFVASQGFRSVQDPFAAARTPAEQERIGAASTELGLSLGCFIFAPVAEALTPMWTANTAEQRGALSRALEHAISIAERIKSSHIAVITGLRPDQPPADQRRAMAENLSWAGDIVATRGMKLCVEAVNSRRLPGMLLNHYVDSVDVVRSAANPAVRLIFDFGHVQAMDGDILYYLDLAWDDIELIQIADNPDRVEPGAGELNFSRLFDALVERKFAGLCELEHNWSRPGADVQQAYLNWLARWRA